jgi:indole-3-glycerol phosphate synthase
MNILEKIIETKKEEVALLKKNYTASSFTDSEFFHNESLKLKRHKDKLSIIAEIKKASPSKGVLKKDFDYMGIAGV